MHGTLSPWPKHELLEKLKEYSNEASRDQGIGGITAEVSTNGERVLTYHERTETFALEMGKLATECHRVMEVAGLANLTLSFNPTHMENAGRASVGFTKSPPNFRRWFLDSFDLKTYTFEFVPDTNIIIKHHLSQTILPILKDYFPKALGVRVPRIAILELERQGNEEGKNWKRRLALNAWSEILWLLDSGASLTTELDAGLMGEFSSLAGARMTDAWIRREIHGDQKKSREQDLPLRSVFVTGDLMSAFAASAEGLDSLYVSTDNETNYHGPLNRFADLVVAAAVRRRATTPDIGGPRKSLALQGIWEGKNISDWREEAVMLA